MKCFFVKILACFLFFGALTSCAGENSGIITLPPEFAQISLFSTNPATLSFEADRSWYIRVDYAENTEEKWLDVSPMSGEAGANSLVIQAVSPNYAEIDRHATVSILIPGSSGVQIDVNQLAAVKPSNLVKLVRSITGTALAGPSEIMLEYSEGGSVMAFTASGTRYEVVKNGSSGTIKTKQGNTEGSINFSLLSGNISSIGPLSWVFSDPNTGTVLKESQVTISFRYDNSGDSKRLRSITRTEIISKEGAVKLETPRKEEEVYTYTTEQLRYSKLERILPYDTSIPEVEFPRDTIIYNFVYPAANEPFEENNLTANVWDLVLFPDNQGTPLYSLTGYWILGLTGVPQSAFPSSTEVETRFHSEGANASLFPSQYVYSFNRDPDNFIGQAVSDIKYNGDTAQRKGVVTFTYATSAAR